MRDDRRGDSQEPLAFSEESEREFQRIRERYPNRRAMVLPALQLTQKEFGHVSVKAMEYIAERLDLPPSKVLSPATFYEMFNRYPRGKHLIRVCTGPSCCLMGAQGILDYLTRRLGIRVGQTTPDRMFSLQSVECLASCGTGPMLECNGQYYENLTPETVEQLVVQWSHQDPKG